MRHSKNHTPGPWHISKQSLPSRAMWVGGKDEGAGFRQEVCDVYTHHEHAKANAALIVAAPELLAALEEIKTVLPTWTKPTHNTSDGKVLAIVLAAIEKAKGGKSE